MTKSVIQVEIKNVMGRLVAYPKDKFSQLYMRAADQYDYDGNLVRAAKCIVAGQMPNLRALAELLDAEIEETYAPNVKGYTLDRWREQSTRTRTATQEPQKKESTDENQ